MYLGLGEVARQHNKIWMPKSEVVQTNIAHVLVSMCRSANHSNAKAEFYSFYQGKTLFEASLRQLGDPCRV